MVVQSLDQGKNSHIQSKKYVITFSLNIDRTFTTR